MHLINYKKLFLAIGLLVAFGPSLAQDATAEDTGVQCVRPASQSSSRFSDLQAAAEELNRQVCIALFEGNFDTFEETQNGLYNEFGLKAIGVASDQLGNSQITDWRRPFDGWLDRISDSPFRNKDIRELVVTTDPMGRTSMHFEDLALAVDIGGSGNTSCGLQQNESCLDVTRDLAVAINVYNDSYASFALQSTRTQLGRLSAAWDDYLNNSRSQTILDLATTTFFERSHFKKDYLVGPPKRQWALLHPSLVIEHANEAMEGKKDEFGVAIEWIGVNWWSDSSPFFGIPFGISLASIYSDRPGIESIGHGAMLHFDNRYSVGWASRSGDSSFYLTLDLLKFVEDKKKQFDRYKSEMLD